MKVRRILAAAAVAAATVAVGVGGGTAQASAIGSQAFGGGNIHTPFGVYPVPRGELDHGVRGRGLYVESQAAGFTAFPPLCNWTMTYELRNLGGDVVDRHTVRPGSRCDSNVNVQGVVWNKRTVPGFACAVLKVGGDRIAEQCHQVAGS